MKNLFYIFIAVLGSFLLLHGCEMNEENITTQKPLTADGNIL